MQLVLNKDADQQPLSLRQGLFCSKVYKSLKRPTGSQAKARNTTLLQIDYTSCLFFVTSCYCRSRSGINHFSEALCYLLLRFFLIYIIIFFFKSYKRDRWKIPSKTISAQKLLDCIKWNNNSKDPLRQKSGKWAKEKAYIHISACIPPD